MKRGRLEILFEFLEALSNQALVGTRLTRKTNTSWEVAQEITRILLQTNLIEATELETDSGLRRGYNITRKGRMALHHYQELIELCPLTKKRVPHQK